MKKRLISMLCVLAMVMTVFASFTVANAATEPIVVEKGINLVADSASTPTEKIIKVYAAGYDYLYSLALNLPLDPSMYSKIAFKWSDSVNAGADTKVVNVNRGALTGSVTDRISAALTSSYGLDLCDEYDNLIATITLTLKEELTKELVLKPIQEGVDAEGKAYFTMQGTTTDGVDETAPATDVATGSVVFAATAAPVETATPEPTATPTPEPVITSEIEVIKQYVDGTVLEDGSVIAGDATSLKATFAISGETSFNFVSFTVSDKTAEAPVTLVTGDGATAVYGLIVNNALIGAADVTAVATFVE